MSRDLADGRYRLDRILGHGGMAVVWLAHDQRLDRPVAVKIIAEAIAADTAYLRRFTREARIAAGLAHPHLVQVYDYSATARPPFLVMEYVDGGTLADRMEAGRAPDAATLARELLSALDVVHRAGILHRDIKPANVLVGGDDRARLSDFGIAHDQDTTHLTRTGQVIGTLRFMAPEVVRGEPASPASDLYSLGRVVEVLDGPPALTHALTDPDPAVRPRTAADALRLLDAAPTTYRRREPTRTAPLPTRPQSPSPARRRRRPLPVPALLAAAGVVLLVLALVSALAGGSSPSALDQRFDRIERLIHVAR